MLIVTVTLSIAVMVYIMFHDGCTCWIALATSTQLDK